MEQALSFDYDMATMALKGKRFKEAEEKFKDLAMRTNSVEAWCGMGLSKFGLIMDDTSIAEVFYCFDKARAVATDENKDDLDTVIQQSSFECTSHLYNLYINAVLSTRSAVDRKYAAIVSTIVGGFSTINAVSKNSNIGTIASAGFTAISYDNYLKSHSSAEELKQAQDEVVRIIEEVKGYVKLSLGESSAKWTEFNSLTERRQQEVIEALKTNDQKAYDKAMVEKEKNIESKKAELSDPNHPFHVSKAEAMLQYEKKEFKRALLFANLAYSYYTEDREINEIRSTILKKFQIKALITAFIIIGLFTLTLALVNADALSKDPAPMTIFYGIIAAIAVVAWLKREKGKSKASFLDVKNLSKTMLTEVSKTDQTYHEARK